jgi:hypothetical protein
VPQRYGSYGKEWHGSNQGDKTKENIREWQSRINRLLLPPKEKTNLRNVYANQLFV